MDKFEGLDEAFETVADIVPAEEPKKKKPPARLEQDDVEKDYEKYARANLYQLVDKGQASAALLIWKHVF